MNIYKKSIDYNPEIKFIILKKAENLSEKVSTDINKTSKRDKKISKNESLLKKSTTSIDSIMKNL
jgi:hypothetical protein